MDPITAVSLVGTIVQLVDFSIKVVSKSTELYRSGRGVLTENTQIETATKDLSKLNAQLKQSTAAGDTELQVLCQACSDVADQLLAALAQVKGKEQKWQSLRKALRSILSKEEIRQLEFRLASFRDQLNRRITIRMR
jgi:molecular chaperone GrpE (heat shock protein)